jgi:hypothetical protein
MLASQGVAEQAARADSAGVSRRLRRDWQASCHPAATPLSHTVGQKGWQWVAEAGLTTIRQWCILYHAVH